MPDYSKLVSAISDVGYWRWWAERLPDVFQVEFGGAQLYIPPEDKNKAPSSITSLRFFRPSYVSFISRKDKFLVIPDDWSRLLKEDKIEPFNITYDEFALNDAPVFQRVVSKIETESIHFQDKNGGKNIEFAFWAGIMGMKITAAEVRPVLNSGEVDLSEIETLHSAWWTYWQEYWEKREAVDALPKDYACEVTIPTGKYKYHERKKDPP